MISFARQRFATGFISLVAPTLLGLLGSLATLRADLMPQLLPELAPPLDREWLAMALFSLISTTIALFQKSRWPRGRVLLAAILVGLGLFVVPALLSEATRGWLPPLSRAALYTLAPFFSVIFEPYLARDTVQNPRLLMGALLSVAGTLLALPISIPQSFQAVLSCLAITTAAACIAATSCVAARITHHEKSSFTSTVPLAVAPLAAIASGVSCLGLITVDALQHRAVLKLSGWPIGAVLASLTWAATVEIPCLFLLFWLTPRISAPRITTRFTLVLLFPIVIGAPLLGSHLAWRDWAGVVMMVGGTFWLLCAHPEELPGHGLFLR